MRQTTVVAALLYYITIKCISSGECACSCWRPFSSLEASQDLLIRSAHQISIPDHLPLCPVAIVFVQILCNFRLQNVNGEHRSSNDNGTKPGTSFTAVSMECSSQMVLLNPAGLWLRFRNFRAQLYATVGLLFPNTQFLESRWICTDSGKKALPHTPIRGLPLWWTSLEKRSITECGHIKPTGP